MEKKTAFEILVENLSFEIVVENFRNLNYRDRLKFMDEYLDGSSSCASELHGEAEFSVIPSTPEETRLYNEWKLQLFEKVLRPGYEQKLRGEVVSIMDDRFFDRFFDLLRDRYTKKVQALKKLDYPDTAIATYIYDQLEEYAPKLKEKRIREAYTKDISEKIIDNLPAFMEARALFNYVGFLEEEKRNFKPSTKKPLPRIPEDILNKLHHAFNGVLWEKIAMPDYLDLFSPDNLKQGRLDGAKNGYQVLIAYLFFNVCVKLGVPYSNLETRVGSFDNIERKSRNPEMRTKINAVIKKMNIKPRFLNIG